jgi:hypothetical protein
MNDRHCYLRAVACLMASAFGAFSADCAHADDIELSPLDDVTIYASSGDLGNGAGPYCFVGNSGMNVPRRTLIRFDQSPIPEGSTIISAILTLNMSMSNAGATNVSVHRCNVSWGEGTSLPKGNGGEGTAATPGDATWTHRFYDTITWSNPGGQFVRTPSATTSVNAPGLYNWNSSNMAANVQHWLTNPNHGWILIGDESGPGLSKRFDTQENPSVSLRPKLMVTYSVCHADVDNDAAVGVQDLLAVILAWGACPNPSSCPADVAPPGPPLGDDTINVEDLLGVISEWGACP